MKKYFLGVDIGGTKSHALVADESGKALGFGVGGPGNHETVGYDGLAATLREITRQALEMAGIKMNQLVGAGFGVAGYDWPSERSVTLDAIEKLGMDCPFEAVNDTVLGLLAGTSEGWGVVVVAGTGENCWGWDRKRCFGRVTGNGAFMGEFGGAGTITHKAIQAISKAWSLRGPITALTKAFIDLTGALDETDLLEGLVLGRYNLGAEHAPVVFEVAAEGDAIAREVIQWAGEELAELAIGVIRQLGFQNERFEIVLVGSMFNGGSLLVEPLCARVQSVAPGANFVYLTARPVVGGVLLGMGCAGVDGYPIRRQLIETTKCLWPNF